jgi:prolipoprotein diacylglyceryl transferase
MRPVLVEIPSKLLFLAALVLAGVSFVRERRRAKENPKEPKSLNWLFLLAGAYALLGLRGGAWIPSVEAFKEPWLPVPIFSYGVMLGTSMVVGWFLALKLAKQDGIPQEHAGAIYMWTAVWSIVGARILYTLANPREFAENPLRFLKLWEGGLVAYGGMIGGFLASWYNCWRRKIPLLQWADASAPSVILGTAITRVGCLLFGCDYGKRSDVAWAIEFPRGRPAWEDHLRNRWIEDGASASLPVHPTQVYEMLAGLFLFAAAMVARKFRRFSGMPFLVWVIGYGILRPIIEMYRDDDQRGAVGPLSTSQFIGIVATVLGMGLLIALVRRHRQDPQALRYWERPIPAPAEGPAEEPDQPRHRGSGASRRRKAR